MKNLFTKIEQIISDRARCPGWCTYEKAVLLASAVLTLRPEYVLEIGVFGGSSFLPMALAMKEIGRGTIIGVDPWAAAASKQGQLNPADEQFWATCDHEKVHNQFMALVKEYELESVVRIERMISDYYEPPEKGFGIVHSDGNHGEQAYRDAMRFLPKVKMGGIAFLDDLDWTGGAVRRAAAFAKSIGFVQIAPIDTGAVYQRLP